MASVSSLDKDLRTMRLDKYTPSRANEVKKWIESILGEPLQTGDLLEALKDGTALCRLANIALGPNAIRFKQSSMPFVQMENISHFLRVCQAPPLSLPPHDVFLTVDLYEQKDPAQVLQCIEAFSRRASATQSTKIPTAIGGRKPTSSMSPQSTGGAQGRNQFSPPRARGESNASLGSPTGSGRTSPVKGQSSSPSGPAWNYAQYGWMGGASQGNQGIAFGARRQITSAAPNVPSLAERERKRREAEAEAERERLEKEEAERQRRFELEQENERLRVEQARRAEEDARRRAEDERRRVEEEQQRWEDEERRWKEEEEARIKEEREAEVRLETDRRRRRANSDARLKGQFLSQYQAEQRQSSAEAERIKELERQLAEAKERERQYEQERQDRVPTATNGKPSLPARQPEPETKPTNPTSDTNEQIWDDTERDYLRAAWSQNQAPPPSKSPRPLPVPQASTSATTTPSRPLPAPSPSSRPLPQPTPPQRDDAFTNTPTRPLPDPSAYKPAPLNPNRTDRYLTSNPAPAPSQTTTHLPSEAAFSSTAESDAEAARRLASQNQTKAGGWASKSLLEREMERERQRQQEWEEAQKQTQDAADRGLRDPTAGAAPGKSWDVNSYGFTGGDSQNKGAQGIYSGRRQILGPRPLEKK